MNHPYRTNVIENARPRHRLWVKIVAAILAVTPLQPSDWRWYRRMLGGYWYKAWVYAGELSALLMWCGPYAEPQDGTGAVIEERESWPDNTGPNATPWYRWHGPYSFALRPHSGTPDHQANKEL